MSVLNFKHPFRYFFRLLVPAEAHHDLIVEFLAHALLISGVYVDPCWSEYCLGEESHCPAIAITQDLPSGRRYY